MKKRTKIKKAIAKRPTEALSGPALGLAVYGFETQVGVPPVLAGIVATACAFGPVVVSGIIDLVKD